MNYARGKYLCRFLKEVGIIMKLQLAIDAKSLDLKKEDLVKLKVGLNSKNMEHKFIPFDQLHIPLIMLGEKTTDEMKVIDEKIENVFKQHQAFDLKLSGIWAYPNQNEGRLLWIGVQNTKELRALQLDLANAIFSESDEKDYKPNLPLVRLKNHRNVSDVISPYKTRDFGKLHVTNVLLYEMTSGAFPTYKMLNDYNMGRSES